MSTTPWAVERELRLEKLWAAGLSASQIALRMGGGLTRNAVIGKVHRLKLEQPEGKMVRNGNPGGRPRDPNKQPRVYPKTPPRLGPRPAPRGRLTGLATMPDHQPDRFVVPETTLAFDYAIPVEQRRSLKGPPDSPYPEIGLHQCRWGVGDPKDREFFFCAGPVADDMPYCASHCKRAFVVRPQMSTHRTYRP